MLFLSLSLLSAPFLGRDIILNVRQSRLRVPRLPLNSSTEAQCVSGHTPRACRFFFSPISTSGFGKEAAGGTCSANVTAMFSLHWFRSLSKRKRDRTRKFAIYHHLDACAERRNRSGFFPTGD